MFTTAHMVATVRRSSCCSERSILDLGWTQAEIDAAVKAGAVRRLTAQLGWAE